MARADDGHSHDAPAWVDLVVWVSVALVVVLAAEWFMGRMARESIAAGATRFLRQQPAPAGDAQQ